MNAMTKKISGFRELSPDEIALVGGGGFEMQNVDTDGDGYATYTEMQVADTRFTEESFDSADTDYNGALDNDELEVLNEDNDNWLDADGDGYGDVIVVTGNPDIAQAAYDKAVYETRALIGLGGGAYAATNYFTGGIPWYVSTALGGTGTMVGPEAYDATVDLLADQYYQWMVTDNWPGGWPGLDMTM